MSLNYSETPEKTSTLHLRSYAISVPQKLKDLHLVLSVPPQNSMKGERCQCEESSQESEAYARMQWE